MTIKITIRIILRVSIIFSFFYNCNIINSQFISNFGVKAGLLFNGFATSDVGNLYNDTKPTDFNYIGYDFGAYAEILNSKHFCISTELHFLTKGETDASSTPIAVPVKSNQGEFYDYFRFSRTFSYISFQLLPRYRLIITGHDKISVFGGPRIDYLVADSNPEYPDALKINSQFEYGITFGLHGLVIDIVSFEFRYDYNFSSTFKFGYGDETITRKHHSLTFLAGVSLKKLLHIGKL